MYRKNTLSEKLVYDMNNDLKHIIDAKDSLTKYDGYLII